MFDGITHVIQTEREDASVYPSPLHSYESRRLPLIMTLSVIHAAWEHYAALDAAEIAMR